ncbi:hypothetical protein LGL55_19790 [Clostridium tagluense]|uniref:hypothetical protein n=1 Tax=Clostridium tagluense TaxID=360422 RepID=UPI001CF0FC78|nr:hypothetical protein [Clostridium tagluense]MCB2313369.1 hypothetical protein [Clostridium tagluense]MCB2318193.1 hypothetical protein [Clostridium tagluense]MCB2322981.1 hypothetical protein [Clostridium tagluense]MCB2327977.1 hypothetical protein [Clostridium tagluense]MCB2332683.1 hypothetical protein [Clostridium tagluense]
MIKIRINKDGEACWNESVNLGILGEFDTICIDLDACAIAEIKDDMSEVGQLIKISKYYGDRFKELEAEFKYINEQFLMWIITHLCDIEYPFWEFGFRDKGSKKYPDYIVEEEMKRFEDENGQVIHDLQNPSFVYKKIQKYNVYTNKDNLTSYEIVDKYLPILDLKKLVDTIEAGSIDTYEDEIHFQVGSEVCGGLLLCATYGTIYEDNKLEVTHNC